MLVIGLRAITASSIAGVVYKDANVIVTTFAAKHELIQAIGEAY